MEGAAAALREAGYEYIRVEGSELEADFCLRQAGDNAKGFEWKGQEDYDRLGNAVSEYLRQMMLEQYALEEENLGTEEEPVPVYSQGLECETLVVLIQGSGAVTPGMWARSLCINNSLREGTIFPYVKSAQQLKWGVVVANPNTRGEGNECAELHTVRLFDKVVARSAAKRVFVVAHSYGGWSMLHYLKQAAPEARDRIRFVAMTDSVHQLQMTVPSDAEVRAAKNPEKQAKLQQARLELKALVPKAFEPPSAEVATFLKLRCRNWVESELPVGELVQEEREGVRAVSAGHKDHVWTSGTAFPDVFATLHGWTHARENLVRALECREAGNAAVKAGNCKTASFNYKKALIYLKGVTKSEDEMSGMCKKVEAKTVKPTDSEQAEANDLEAVVNNNLAHARLKLEDWKGGLGAAEVCLKAQPQNAKALFRAGTARAKLGDFIEARELADKLEPLDASAAASLRKELKQLAAHAKEEEKERFKNMFQ